MITVQLLGGMGNQMFQCAFAQALQAKGYAVQLDKSMLITGNPHPPIREYSLDAFGEIPFGNPEGDTIRERSSRYSPENLSPRDPSTMLGYWQSEKYFKDIENEVRTSFTFRNRLSNYALETIREIENSDSIAIHVRRTDFFDHLAFHGMPTLDYYRESIRLIRSYYPNTKAFVFSDDRQWCRENFPGDFRIVEGRTKHEDLQLMSLCNHIVLANSTFSWWAAWLGDTKARRIVIAPKNWFAPSSGVDTTDIVPERWMRL